jgi:chromosome segregation ATPase
VYQRESIELVAENLVLAHDLAIKDLERAETLAEQEIDDSIPRAKSPELKKRTAPSKNTASPPSRSVKPAKLHNSAFLSGIVSCDMQNDRASVATCGSQASIRSTLLASKWTVSSRYTRSIVHSENRHVSQATEIQATSAALQEVVISRSLRSWTELSAQWQGTIDKSVSQIQTNSSAQNKDSMTTRLCEQLTGWSSTCGLLSKALDELQQAHEGVKSDYEAFLQSSVRGQEKLLKIVEQRETQVLELRQQHSIDVKQLITRVSETHAELGHMRTELESTKSERDNLSKETDDIKLDLQTALANAKRLTIAIEEEELKFAQLQQEITDLRSELDQRNHQEQALRRQVANEKAQRLEAIQYLTEAFGEGASRKDSAIEVGVDQSQ